VIEKRAILLQCILSLLALSGHRSCPLSCPLLGVKPDVAD
jgi:hypothetical protein